MHGGNLNNSEDSKSEAPFDFQSSEVEHNKLLHSGSQYEYNEPGIPDAAPSVYTPEFLTGIVHSKGRQSIHLLAQPRILSAFIQRRQEEGADGSEDVR